MSTTATSRAEGHVVGPRIVVERPIPRLALAPTLAPALLPELSTPPERVLLVKHGVDRIVALVLVLLLLPLLVALALGVKLSSAGPVLYRQRRIGRDGRSFDILKFRSMVLAGAPHRFLLPVGHAPGGVEGEDRRTPIGKLLRRTSLDELPQLLNVVRGEMSLVGPRPERPHFVQLFAAEVPGYVDRHRMRVGITGLAQVRGLRGQTSIAERVQADNEYIDSWSLALDAKVLARTARAMLRSVE